MTSLQHSVEIDAPPAAVWAVYSDVARWPEWTASVDAARPLDGPDLEIGRRFEIDQPRFPRLTWVVTDVSPGRSWTWRVHSPGATTTASHGLVDLPGGRTRVDTRVDQRGILGAVVGLLTRRRGRRYLALEAAGLKARAEGRTVDASST
jgi:hypothetical protein